MPAVASDPALQAVETPSFQWTRERYDLAVESGVFTPDDKIELLEGELVPIMSQNSLHRVATALVVEALRKIFGRRGFVQSQAPIALSGWSEPEPDAVVVKGGPRDYMEDHPGPAAMLLIVEVSDSTLRKDRSRKAFLYAEAGIVEYWIVNLQDSILEVHRDPSGDAYRTKMTLGSGETVSPIQAPDATIAVADLLP